MARIEKDLDILKTKLLNGNYCEADIERIMRAAGFGKIWHADQKRASGEPYFIHPIQVASILIDLNLDCETIIAALLHDVVEDTGMTFDDLLRLGVDETIVDALRLLTHTDDMTYEEYVNRIATSGNGIALHVKYNDLQHNLKRGRAGGHYKQVAKHENALAVIEPLMNRRKK